MVFISDGSPSDLPALPFFRNFKVFTILVLLGTSIETFSRSPSGDVSGLSGVGGGWLSIIAYRKGTTTDMSDFTNCSPVQHSQSITQSEALRC